MARLSNRVQAWVQPHLAGIEPYDPNFTPTAINLSANENTYPLPACVREALDAALAATPANRYPDPMANELRDELAAWHGVARENVCVGNGGDELLYNFLLAFGGEGRTLLNCPPCFSEYEFFASLTQTQVNAVWRDEKTFELNEEAMLAAALHANMAIVTSPNNPTGNMVSASFVEALCAACPGPVMVDEAYIEFAGPDASVAGLLEACSNLVILRTLSKAFGMAGARCGYVLAAPDIIEAFAAIRQIYSVNVFTQAAACAVVRKRAALDETLRTVARERERVIRAVNGLAEGGCRRIRAWPSSANFVLVHVPHAHEVRERLRDAYSILVRDFSAAPGLENCLRITVGTPEENDAVIAALSELVG